MKEDKVGDKIIEIEKYLEELEEFIPPTLTFEEYSKDIGKKAIFERYLEKIVEAVIDLSFLIMNKKDLIKPDEEEKIFDVLKNNGIISETLAQKFREAKGMRNIIAHRYGEIDDEIVFEAITQNLISDVNEFLEMMRANRN